MGKQHVTADDNITRNEKMYIGLKLREELTRVIVTAFMYILGVAMIVPFIWMISASLKRESQVFTYPIQWIPTEIVFSNYEKIWFGTNPFSVFYLNSISVSFWTVIGLLLVSSLSAYAFARISFRGRDFIFLLYLTTMMIPPQVTLIPKFIMFKWLGLLDTHLSIILPGMFTAFGVFMLRQFFISIPFELSESAYIDGASELRIWWQIIMPLAKPAFASLTILQLVWSWNDYMTPLIFLRSKKLFTIPLGLDFFMSEMGTEYSLMMAAAVSTILPLLIIYFIGQKQFIESIASSGIKG